jgi:hypothetical protein
MLSVDEAAQQRSNATTKKACSGETNLLSKAAAQRGYKQET